MLRALNIQTIKSITIVRSVLAIQVLALFCLLVKMYFSFNVNWVDTDQFLMWEGLSDFASGNFYEPRYYAQDYNTFLEPLLALPFYKLGMPVYYALPLATHILFVVPIIATVFIFLHYKKGWQAVIFMSLILAMNPSYFLLNTQPRGFVTGLFFCSFLLVSVFEPQRYGWLATNMLLAALAFFVNPNSILYSIPLALFVLLKTYQNKSIYIVALAALPTFWLFDNWFNGFYRTHPEYIKTGLSLGFSWKYFLENLHQLDSVFAQLSPFREGNSLFLILFFFYLLLLLLRQRKSQAIIAVLLFLLVLLVSFSLGKTLDGSTWAYLSYSRMYLAIPFVLAFMLSQTKLKKGAVPGIVAVVIIGWVIAGWTELDARLNKHFDDKNWNALGLIKTKDALNAMEVYAQKCKEHQQQFLLVSHSFWLNTGLAYGGKALLTWYPKTMENYWDKRYWVRQKYENRVLPEFMMISSDFAIAEKLKGKGDFEIEDVDGYGLVLIKKNTMTLGDFSMLEHQLK